MLGRKRNKLKKQGDAVGGFEKLPNEFLTWSEKKQKEYIRELLRSMSPMKVKKPDLK